MGKDLKFQCQGCFEKIKPLYPLQVFLGKILCYNRRLGSKEHYLSTLFQGLWQFHK